MLNNEIKTNNQIFIEKWKNFIDLLGKYMNENFSTDSDLISHSLSKISILRKDSDFLDLCREIRNQYSHKKAFDNYVDIQQTLLEKLDKIILDIESVMNLTASKIMITNIRKTNKNECISDLVFEMKEKTYTAIPIVNEEEKVIGVFSESSLLNYFANHKEVCLARDEKISEFFKDDGSIVEDEIGFARKNEYYLFSSKRTPVFELKKIFTEKFEKGDRVGAIFITENGKQSERLLGIITSWDLVGK